MRSPRDVRTHRRRKLWVSWVSYHLHPWVLCPLHTQASYLLSMSHTWDRLLYFQIPSPAEHEVPSIRANKIPRKSDLEIEPPMRFYPNFSFTREVSLKKKNLKRLYGLKPKRATQSSSLEFFWRQRRPRVSLPGSSGLLGGGGRLAVAQAVSDSVPVAQFPK